MSSPTLVMQVCPPPRAPRRDLRMVWYLAGSLAVHLGGWAVLEAAPPEEPIFDINWGGESMEPIDDFVPREMPDGALDLEHCDVRSDDWAGCVLGAWSSYVPVDGILARSDDRVGCLHGASFSSFWLNDYLMGPGPRDLNPLYGLEGPCSVGPFGRDAPCGFPGAGLDPKLGLEIRGPRYRFAYHERPTRPSVVHMARAAVMSSPGYDRSIVRRYLRRHLGEIGACYEAQQLAHPDRAGDVAVAFFITPTGEVPSSSGSGFDAGIAGCVADVVKTITFPRPRDGEGVQVNYSFQFQAPRE